MPQKNGLSIQLISRPVRRRTAFRRKKYLGRKPSIKRKVNSLKKADKAFSEEIRQRDGKCLFPMCRVTDLKKLQCSHYWGRSTKSTRFDPDNCISLCWLHHYKDKMLGFEYQKQTIEKQGYDGQYTLWMKAWLGKERWDALYARSKQSIKQSKAIEEYYQKS